MSKAAEAASDQPAGHTVTFMTECSPAIYQNASQINNVNKLRVMITE